MEDLGEDIPQDCKWAIKSVNELYAPSRTGNWRGGTQSQPPPPPYPPAPTAHMKSASSKFRIPPQICLRYERGGEALHLNRTGNGFQRD
eukprot:11909440-Prorocentrum_lima.AAC.1